MSFKSYENEKAEKKLKDNGYSKQQNGGGWQKDGKVVKQNGNVWNDKNGNTFHDWNSFSKTKKI